MIYSCFAAAQFGSSFWDLHDYSFPFLSQAFSTNEMHQATDPNKGMKRQREEGETSKAKRLKGKEYGCSTYRLIKAADGNNLSFGDGKWMPLEVFAKHLLPHLSIQDLHRVFFAHKASLSLFKNWEVVSKLFSSPGIDYVKLGSLLDSSLTGPLTHIDLIGSRKSDKEIGSFIQKLSNLTSLNFEQCPKISGPLMKALFLGCANLTCLKLSKCGRVTETAIREISGRCQNLTSLDFSECQIKGKGFDSIFKNSQRLMHLNLSCCTGKLTSTIRVLAENCTGLISLNLFGCRISDEETAILAKNCTNLAALSLYSLNVANESILALAKSLTQLTDLNLSRSYQSDGESRINDETLATLVRCRTNLKRLGLSWYGASLTDAAIYALIQHCPNLTGLELNGCQAITDAAMQAFAQKFQGLTGIGLGEIRNIREPTIEALIQGSPTLTILNLSHCNVTYNVLCMLAKSCTNLARLNLRGFNITSAGLQTLAQGCPKLTALDLFNCHGIDDGLQELAQRCSNLTVLDLQHCSFGDLALDTFAKSCSNLEILSLTGMTKIAFERVQNLVKKCRKLRILELSIGDSAALKQINSELSITKTRENAYRSSSYAC